VKGELVGNLDDDLALSAHGNGAYRAVVSRDWEMWGPLGGYVAAMALRAAGRESPFSRPISFSSHFVSVAAFDEVAIDVRCVRAGRSAASHHVRISQQDRTILEAAVWSADVGEGPEHLECPAPRVVRPPSLAASSDEDQQLFPFSRNFLVGSAHDPANGPYPETATWQVWASFIPEPCFSDPWLDSCRSVIVLDVSSYMAASNRHGGGQIPYFAPSLDINVAFHLDATTSEWLLIDTHAPISSGGLFCWRGHVWTSSGAIVASAQGQNLWRKL
jgi:acyl-CoA thioesterase II